MTRVCLIVTCRGSVRVARAVNPGGPQHGLVLGQSGRVGLRKLRVRALLLAFLSHLQRLVVCPRVGGFLACARRGATLRGHLSHLRHLSGLPRATFAPSQHTFIRLSASEIWAQDVVNEEVGDSVRRRRRRRMKRRVSRGRSSELGLTRLTPSVPSHSLLILIHPDTDTLPLSPRALSLTPFTALIRHFTDRLHSTLLAL